PAPAPSQSARRWRATDDGGNTATASQVLTVTDTSAPTVVSCPSDETIQCPAVPSCATRVFANNCDDALSIVPVDVTTPSGGPCANAHDVTRTWTATDNCNNTISCSQTIHVVDTTAPQLVNVPSDDNVSCDNVPPPAAVTASDACD